MKKIILLTALFSPLTLASSEPTGYIFSSECDPELNIGVAEVRRINGKELESIWYKVKSEELCSYSEKQHPMFLGKSTKLTEISAENFVSNTPTESRLILDENGFLIDVEKVGKINIAYFQGINSHIQKNNKSANRWYFKEKFK
jgi:hypothetical protein